MQDKKDSNQTRDDGVIKFNFQLKVGPKVEESDFLALEKWRAIFFRMNFIGEYQPEAIGFGNLSKRTSQDSFIITGSQTGKHAQLQREQYCKVIQCEPKKQKVVALGTVPPSSESLTHFAIYSTSPHINFVFHIHHDLFWEKMLNGDYDKTPDGIPYGTTEMAEETAKIIGNNVSGIFAMAGHEGGIISYGRTAEEAGRIILDTYKIIKD